MNILADALTKAGVSTPEYTQGQKYEDPVGRKFFYGKNEGTASTVAGQAVGAFLTTPAVGAVSMTAATVVESTLGTATPAAGFALSVLAEDEYGWIQYSGPNLVALVTDDGVAAGDPCVIDGGATPSFDLDTAIAGEEHLVCAIALAADASNALAVGDARIVNCMGP